MKELTRVTLNEEDDGDITASFPEKPTAQQLDLLLRAIGRARQTIEPLVPDSPTKGLGDLDVVPNPKWEVGQVFPHGRVLMLRHPMFGWLTFHMPEGLPERICATALSTPPSLPDQGEKH